MGFHYERPPPQGLDAAALGAHRARSLPRGSISLARIGPRAAKHPPGPAPQVMSAMLCAISNGGAKSMVCRGEYMSGCPMLLKGAE